MKYCYTDWDKVFKIPNDRRYCTVVALCIVTQWSMEDSNHWMGLFGRKRNRGMCLESQHKALTSMTQYKAVKGPYTKDNRITIKKFIEKHPEGRYYCLCRGHAFAIVDGVLYDHTEKWRRQITCAYRVYTKEELL